MENTHLTYYEAAGPCIVCCFNSDRILYRSNIILLMFQWSFCVTIDYIRLVDMKLVSAPPALCWFCAPILYPSTIHCKFIPSKLHTHNTQHAQKLIECWSKFMQVLLEKLFHFAMYAHRTSIYSNRTVYIRA